MEIHTPSSLYIGLMSGTSMDGVDAVLADFSGSAPIVLRSVQRDYSSELLHTLRAAALGESMPAKAWLELDKQVGCFFAEAATAVSSGYKPQDIAAIGSHGQTVWHTPEGKHSSSWQLGDPNIIAAQTGISTVADFRRMDMALGGQGAPLTPAFHADVFASDTETRVILNLGGIANITVLAANGSVTGYDTGPANCLLDAHCRQELQKAFDHNGKWASSGHSNSVLLASMLSDPYFEQAAPKSTGPEYFSWNWVLQHSKTEPCAPSDLQATLLKLTAQSIGHAIQTHNPSHVIACGGGVKNPPLMRSIKKALADTTALETTAEYGIDPQAVEALAFAWLAKQRVEGKPGNLPAVTGASRPCCLGAIYRS